MNSFFWSATTGESAEAGHQDFHHGFRLEASVAVQVPVRFRHQLDRFGYRPAAETTVGVVRLLGGEPRLDAQRSSGFDLGPRFNPVESRELGVVAVENRHDLQGVAAATMHHASHERDGIGGASDIESIGEVPRRHATAFAEEWLDVRRGETNTLAVRRRENFQKAIETTGVLTELLGNPGRRRPIEPDPVL